MMKTDLAAGTKFVCYKQVDLLPVLLTTASISGTKNHYSALANVYIHLRVVFNKNYICQLFAGSIYICLRKFLIC